MKRPFTNLNIKMLSTIWKKKNWKNFVKLEKRVHSISSAVIGPAQSQSWPIGSSTTFHCYTVIKRTKNIGPWKRKITIGPPGKCPVYPMASPAVIQGPLLEPKVKTCIWWIFHHNLVFHQYRFWKKFTTYVVQSRSKV